MAQNLCQGGFVRASKYEGWTVVVEDGYAIVALIATMSNHDALERLAGRSHTWEAPDTFGGHDEGFDEGDEL